MIVIADVCGSVNTISQTMRTDFHQIRRIGSGTDWLEMIKCWDLQVQN